MAKYKIKKRVGGNMLPLRKESTNKKNNDNRTASTKDVLKAIKKSHIKHSKMLKMLAT